MIVGVDEELEMLPELVVAIVVVALDGCVLDGIASISASRNATAVGRSALV